MKIHSRQKQFSRNFSREKFPDNGDAQPRNTQQNYSINNMEKYIKTSYIRIKLFVQCFSKKRKKKNRKRMRNETNDFQPEGEPEKRKRRPREMKVLRAICFARGSSNVRRIRETRVHRWLFKR